MADLELAQSVPLVRGDEGVLRVTGSRVTFDTLVGQFKTGATPEQIQEDFPSLELKDIYSVIAFYLQNSEKAEAYLREQSAAGTQFKEEFQRQPRNLHLREQLVRRRHKQKI